MLFTIQVKVYKRNRVIMKMKISYINNLFKFPKNTLKTKQNILKLKKKYFAKTDICKYWYLQYSLN